MGMTKDEVLKIMLDSMNEDNLQMCQHAGLNEEDTKKQIEQSQPSLVFMLNNIYDKLNSAGQLV
jgi:hypothetical protein